MLQLCEDRIWETDRVLCDNSIIVFHKNISYQVCPEIRYYFHYEHNIFLSVQKCILFQKMLSLTLTCFVFSGLSQTGLIYGWLSQIALIGSCNSAFHSAFMDYFKRDAKLQHFHMQYNSLRSDFKNNGHYALIFVNALHFHMQKEPERSPGDKLPMYAFIRRSFD